MTKIHHKIHHQILLFFPSNFHLRNRGFIPSLAAPPIPRAPHQLLQLRPRHHRSGDLGRPQRPARTSPHLAGPWALAKLPGLPPGLVKPGVSHGFFRWVFCCLIPCINGFIMDLLPGYLPVRHGTSPFWSSVNHLFRLDNGITMVTNSPVCQWDDPTDPQKALTKQDYTWKTAVLGVGVRHSYIQ